MVFSKELMRMFRVVAVERRIPTRVRQLPKSIPSSIYKWMITLGGEGHSGVIHLVYFSCSKHFKYLSVSLRSLKNIDRKYLGNIYLYIDRTDPLRPEQLEEVAKLPFSVEVMETGPIKGWGVDMVSMELGAYGEVSKRSGIGDYVAKVDSDVLFVSDEIFKYVVRSKMDLVGDGPYVNYAYAQGGMYFLSKLVAEKISSCEREDVEEFMLDELNTTAEDIAITALVRRYSSKVWLTRFLMFPEEMHNLGGVDGANPNRITAIHFVQEKEAMIGLL